MQLFEICEEQLPTSPNWLILQVTTNLMREGSGRSDPANYRPIVRVAFLLKLLEPVIASHFIVYFDANDLHVLPALKSGFRRNYTLLRLFIFSLLFSLYVAMDAGRLLLVLINARPSSVF